jgi:hypothetical protein
MRRKIIGATLFVEGIPELKYSPRWTNRAAFRSEIERAKVMDTFVVHHHADKLSPTYCGEDCRGICCVDVLLRFLSSAIRVLRRL